jgi:hypothetical protein
MIASTKSLFIYFFNKNFNRCIIDEVDGSATQQATK